MANTADAFDTREHYTKYEYLIPMRDGVKLFTSVLVPKDASTPYPFVMVRTPFGIGPYGSDEYSTAATHTDAFLKAGYIWVRQDVRGRRLSEGRFVPMTPHRPQKRTHTDVDESTDTYDTVEWLLQHVPNHNGRLGLWGISYASFYTAAGIIDTHPAIKAASPQAPVADFFLNDDWYHGGAFKLAAAFGFSAFFRPREAGALAFEPPAAADASDSYLSDPAKPVPFIGYTAPEVPEEFMVADQRFAATRPDVLVYATEPLEEDLTLAGPVSPQLFVSTIGTDSDWVVKLIDVYPPDRSTPAATSGAEALTDVGPPGVTLAGYQQLVRGEPFRGKFRKSFEHPEPFAPGKVETVNFTMPDVNHVFRRGHRVMVQVQSSWFPLVDRNPQTFVNIPTAKPEDFKSATQRVVRSQAQPSGVEVYVLPAA